MISAGNDIVALKTVDQQRTQNPAFYSKFITPAEFALHKPDEITLVNFVWLLWSAKESAYKYLKRFNPDLIFAPVKLTVQKISILNSSKNEENTHKLYSGEIVEGDITLRFLSTVNDDFIATVIDQGDVQWAVKSIDNSDNSDHESQSKAVRIFLLEGLKMSDVSIAKHASGYPVLIKEGLELDIAVSFAHHDSYISYCYQISK